MAPRLDPGMPRRARGLANRENSLARLSFRRPAAAHGGEEERMQATRTAPAGTAGTASGPESAPVESGGAGRPDSYKWIALSNTTLGVLMATINSSILLIALPDIFRGIHVNPLAPSSGGYLLWLIMSFMLVTAVLVMNLGKLGDIFGRVKIYNAGFAVFTVFSVLLAVTWLAGTAGAMWLILMRVGQGIGGAMLFANSSAILTDAFPENQRGMAMGINQVAAIGGSFVGLVLGGVLAPVEWHMVFLVSVPIGIFGTVWAYRKLEEHGVR